MDAGHQVDRPAPISFLGLTAEEFVDKAKVIQFKRHYLKMVTEAINPKKNLKRAIMCRANFVCF